MTNEWLHKRTLVGLLLTSLVVVYAKDTVAEIDPRDWTYCRGPEYTGKSREKGLVDTFDLRRGTNVSWKNYYLGGRSSPIVMNGKL